MSSEMCAQGETFVRTIRADKGLALDEYGRPHLNAARAALPNPIVGEQSRTN